MTQDQANPTTDNELELRTVYGFITTAFARGTRDGQLAGIVKRCTESASHWRAEFADAAQAVIDGRPADGRLARAASDLVSAQVLEDFARNVVTYYALIGNDTAAKKLAPVLDAAEADPATLGNPITIAFGLALYDTYRTPADRRSQHVAAAFEAVEADTRAAMLRGDFDGQYLTSGYALDLIHLGRQARRLLDE